MLFFSGTKQLGGQAGQRNPNKQAPSCYKNEGHNQKHLISLPDCYRDLDSDEGMDIVMNYCSLFCSQRIESGEL